MRPRLDGGGTDLPRDRHTALLSCANPGSVYSQLMEDRCMKAERIQTGDTLYDLYPGRN